MSDLDEKTRAKIAFADEVLATLAAEGDWSPATLDEIAAAAFNRNLAHTDDDGLFAVTP